MHKREKLMVTRAKLQGPIPSQDILLPLKDRHTVRKIKVSHKFITLWILAGPAVKLLFQVQKWLRLQARINHCTHLGKQRED